MKNLTTLVLMLLLVLPVLLPAATTWESMQAPLTQLFGLVLTIFGVPLLIKLGKKWGLTIDEQLAQDAIDALINILANIESGNGKDATGAMKKQLAVVTAQNVLTNAQQTVLVKKYGSLEAAVQVAFERSSLNKNGVK